MKYKMETGATTAKVVAVTVAMVLAPYLLYALKVIFPEVPLPDKDLVQTLIESVILGATAWFVGRQKRPNKKDVAVPDPQV